MFKSLNIIICIALIFFSCNPDKKFEFVIGVSQCSDDSWRHTLNAEIKREASFYGNVEVIIKMVKDDSEQQIKDIQYFIDLKVDLLVISPNESTVLTPIVTKAYKSGIPVILLDRRTDTDDYTSYIGADNKQIGKEVGIYVVDLIGGKGNVVEIRGWEGSTSDLDRHNGFMEVINRYPDIKIIERYGDYLKDSAEKQMSEILSENSQIDVVFAFNDRMATGVYNALKRYSGGHPFIIGIDALLDEGIQNVQKGIQYASFMYPTGGDKVIELAMKILNDEPFERENTLYTAVVDNTNARIMQLQAEQILAQHEKLDEMNSRLNHSIMLYTNQRLLFYATAIILFIILVLLFFTIRAYRIKNKFNIRLKQQNKEIKHQAEILEEQKEQLITLSKQLEDVTNAKLVFFTNISHEFRTPLTLILSPVEYLLASGSLTDTQKELLDIVKRSSNSLLHLISQVIEFRSFENGKMRACFAKNDMKSFLEELNIPLIDYAKRCQINFVFEIDSSSFLMWFDREKIEKIYFNLVSNALKHTERNHQIKISLSKEVIDGQEYASLSVFNEGKIIPKEHINRIFDQFYKVNPYDVGAGIGLAYTSALVDIHNGKISVESIEDKGTTFKALFPFNQTVTENDIKENDFYTSGYIKSRLGIESEKSFEEPILSDLSDNEKPIVLLIEDNPDMRNYLLFVLRDDYMVVEAEDGDEGIEKSTKYIPDVIICDVMIQGKDGFEVCHILKEKVSTSHIPIILLTACSLDEQKAIGFEQGADAYIPKPFNTDLLKIRIRKLIENRQKIKQIFGSSLINDTKKTSLAKKEQEFINRLKKYIEQNISKTDLNVDDIAKEMNLSRAQLYRKLNSLTDYSPNDMIKIIRLKYAHQLLSNKTANISEVAYESGFSTPSYFTKCFKEYYKESPTEFLKNNQ